MRIYLLLILVWFAKTSVVAQANRFAIKNASDVFWYAGIIDAGYLMPLQPGFTAATENNDYNNQIQPLLLSTNGEVIWCEQPLSIMDANDSLIVSSAKEKINYVKAGNNLKEAYAYATEHYFPPHGKIPDQLLFTAPQYNTWIELMYNQNQKDILQYATNILRNHMPAGVLMIDDNWQEDYGKLTFKCAKFPSPKKMIDSLHKQGFKVMLWVCPFISPDCDVYRYLSKNNLLLKDSSGQDAIMRWWNGASALLDLTNPESVQWFKSQLNDLMTEYKVDGFKFDAGDYHFYKGTISHIPVPTTMQTELYAKIGLNYPLNEFRAMFKMGNQPLVNRLADKKHTWEDLEKLIPNMIIEGLMGYPFSCPDMIGGGEFTSFLNGAVIDQELIVRSAQCHALMPMMQFSVAPWRILDKTHLDAVLQAVRLREKFKNYILQTAKESAITGAPILRTMEYCFPNKSYALIKDQFLLGDSLLVAPVVQKGVKSRMVQIPEGVWKDVDGKSIEGPKKIEAHVELNTLLYFVKEKNIKKKNS